MSDITNFLLTTLIGLLAYIGKVFYDKLGELSNKIESILINDMSVTKDVEFLKDSQRDHESRISELEK